MKCLKCSSEDIDKVPEVEDRFRCQGCGEEGCEKLFTADAFSNRNILDFYYLEAMMNRASRLPEAPLPSQERWRNDLGRAYQAFVKGFARAIRDYLVATCIGEARHGENEGVGYFTALPRGGGRSGAYQVARGFSPRCIDDLIKLFQLPWKSDGYGGPAWVRVARAAKLYGTVPDGIFIDLVVSVEHNGGNVFNKREIRFLLPFEISHHAQEHLRSFLNHKMERDLLSASPPEAFVPLATCLSRETLSLLERYFVVVARDESIPKWLRYDCWGERKRPTRKLPRKYHFEWGYGSPGQLIVIDPETGKEEAYKDYVEKTKEIEKEKREV